MKTLFSKINFLLAFLVASTIVVNAQTKASIIGIDHVGINVPDMNQAVDFFQNVLGFTSVTQLGPVQLDTSWKNLNRIHPSTGAVTIKMVYAGTGANIELFHYDNNQGSVSQPYSDDQSATHIAFYTSDMDYAVKYLQSKNVKILGSPFTMPAGDTKDETWVYFLTPWGSKLELVSYPKGKGYEQNNPKVKLWSPKNNYISNNNQNNSIMDSTTIIAQVDQHLKIWNEKDLNKRVLLMKNTYNNDIEMVDRHFVANGWDQINGFVNKLQSENPYAHFMPQKPIEAHHNVARLFWQFGTKENPSLVTGMDLFVFENGKVQKLYVFVNSDK